jgi:hypothetical protein
LTDIEFLPEGKGVGVEARELKSKERGADFVGVEEREGQGMEEVGLVLMNGKGLRVGLMGVTGGSAITVERVELG